MNIAIMGATGQVGKSLVYSFLNDRDRSDVLYLFVRNREKLEIFLDSIGPNLSQIQICALDELHEHDYNVIINCVGFGTPEGIRDNLASIIELNEKYDNLVIDYLQKINSTCHYIYMSSGIVYDSKQDRGTEEGDLISIDLNNLENENPYRISKVMTEMKHRMLSEFAITDIRIFGFCSQFMDFESSFFLAELFQATKKRETFVTNDIDIIRDYISDEDFYSFILACIHFDKNNFSVDACSKQPVKKMDLLAAFKRNFGLSYSIETLKIKNPTGLKLNYYSRVQQGLTYQKHSSLENVVEIYRVYSNE